MKRDVQFLTSKEVNKTELVNVLKTDVLKNFSNEDTLIIKNLLQQFEQNDFSFLSPQEIQFLNTNPRETWAKYLVFRSKFNSNPVNHVVSSFPLYLLIEPVSACNLRCIMCYQIDESFSGNKDFMGYMDLDLFKKVIDEAHSGGTQAITLASRGEPTLHPKFGEMLEYCSGKFLELKINTNATKLPEDLIKKIIESGVTEVVFSVDSYEKANYEKIRVKGIFEHVVSNIQRFQKIRDTSYPNSKCATRVSGVKVDKDQDPELFKKFWEPYVDHVAMVELRERWDTYNNPLELVGSGPCALLWERMYVWYDGTCNVCDIDYKSLLSPGSLKNKSIKEIWHSDAYTELRENHKRDLREKCFPCDRCPHGA